MRWRSGLCLITEAGSAFFFIPSQVPDDATPLSTRGKGWLQVARGRWNGNYHGDPTHIAKMSDASMAVELESALVVLEVACVSYLSESLPKRGGVKMLQVQGYSKGGK